MPVDIESPMEIKLTEQRVEEDDVPRINGKPAIQHVFEANGKLCYLAVVAEGLLPEASEALQQYLDILAGQHASTLKTVPADQVTACDMSMHIFNPGRHLKYGLPIREWDGQSYRRQLIEFDDDYDATYTFGDSYSGIGTGTTDVINVDGFLYMSVGSVPGGTYTDVVNVTVYF